MRNNNLFPPSIISYASEKKFENILIQAKKQSKTLEEYVYFVTHKVNNIKHENDRIYMKIDDSGQLYANSVSQFSEIFWQNIEPKIKPLIEILHKKRYLSYSSCQGHGFTFRRYVGLAFADKESRQYFADFIMNLKIKGIKVNYLDSVINQKVEIKNDKLNYIKKFNKEEMEIRKTKEKESEINTFNIEFHRNYTEYYFLELIILEPVEPNWKIIMSPIKNLWLWYMKKFNWDNITNRLIKELQKESFKKYKY